MLQCSHNLSLCYKQALTHHRIYNIYPNSKLAYQVYLELYATGHLGPQTLLDASNHNLPFEYSSACGQEGALCFFPEWCISLHFSNLLITLSAAHLPGQNSSFWSHYGRQGRRRDAGAAGWPTVQ